ncbi:histidine--tRNA ligase [Buchnera aphidicola]|uniref:Histidine--tRNA ligase n=1 Tax=Buchnera aphidicola (Therioaphis trifolii) TaxID=1241884 RepID=A0A4D6YG75_9GAMM|nr:histidine--tRNA ligase [Buchnera aphidicola]QCI27193.1 histidine--tRNA ligase [Buchnera aphidicola (Therioaphis trifolii)]
MNYIFKSIKGMHDYLPQDILIWNKIENILKKILYSYSYHEIRFPIVEKTILFQKSIGNTTDIIGKEMYSFYDKKGINITLRPEGTTSCARFVIQNKLLYHQKQKLWYYGPMFRYERPQKGRYRQFYQFGIETFGFSDPEIELELILLINKFFNQLKISKFITLEINSIGSIAERNKYKIKLKKFLKKYINVLDKNYLRKLDQNALRILDSKDQNIQNILLKAPRLIDFINLKSRLCFNKLCNLMDHFNIPYVINYNLIRGLDYYNDIVFEWKTNYLGSKNTICAGGRYNKLINILKGPNIPAAGLAIGMDRLLLLIQSLSIFSKNIIKYDILIFFYEKTLKYNAIFLSEHIRNIIPTLKVLLEFQPIKLKKIFKNINKYYCKIILFVKDINIINVYDIKNKIHEDIKKKNIINKICNILQL